MTDGLGRSMAQKMHDAYMNHAGAGYGESDSSFVRQGIVIDPDVQKAQIEAEVAEVVELLKDDEAELEVPNHLEGWLDEALREVRAIMLERGQKYGPGNIAEFGELGVLVRLSDKLARLRHSSGRDFADETSRDAWIDIIGYGLIGLGWADKNWPGSEK